MRRVREIRVGGLVRESPEAVFEFLAADPPHQMVGMAQVGSRTRAYVRWKLRARAGGTEVGLEATIDRAGALDRLLLLLGGRRWLERRFSDVLVRLEERLTTARGRVQRVA
jgi:hypothetical protein